MLQLMPTGKIHLAVDGASAAWTKSLHVTLSHEGVSTVPAGTLDAFDVHIKVATRAEWGEADLGAEFVAVGASAIVTVGRVRVEITARPGVAADEDEARREAMSDLRRRVVEALTL